MKISALLQHRQVLAFLTENNLTPPTIPSGCNTVYKDMVLANGHAAICVNQTGFTPEQRDNEEEVNGLLLFICDQSATETVKAQMRQWLDDFMEKP